MHAKQPTKTTTSKNSCSADKRITNVVLQAAACLLHLKTRLLTADLWRTADTYVADLGALYHLTFLHSQHSIKATSAAAAAAALKTD